MKRFILLVAVTVLAVPAFCTAAGAMGKGTFKADLSGTYSFASTQVRMTYPPGGTEKVVEYCSGYGTATFDGFMKVVIASTDRCSISGTITEVITRYYVEEPDGTFLVKETLEAATPRTAGWWSANARFCATGQRPILIPCRSMTWQ